MMAKFEVHNVIRKPDIRGSVSLIGRTMIVLGLILLLFVAYQLWGTNLFTQKSQNSLRDRFDKKLEKVKKANVKPSTPSQPNDDEIPGDNPTIKTDSNPSINELQQEVKRGEPIAIIKIDKIGLNHIVVSGTDKNSLQKGPGHYPATPLPGQFGNAAIAGHRTTYGAPFHRLDEVGVGDIIVLETVRGTFTYRVNQPNQVVSPGDVSVINPTTDPNDPSKLLTTLTLTTCHPKYSAEKRLIVKAILVADRSATATEPNQLKDKKGNIPQVIDIGDDNTLKSETPTHSNILVAMVGTSLHLPLLWWLLLLVTVGMVWWYFYRRYRNWQIWFIGAIPFAAALLMYFVYLEHALPSNL